MAVLINAATGDAASSAVSASGPIIVSVVGTFKTGLVSITANLGAGEAVAATFTPADQTKICRLEFATGVTFKAYLTGTGTGNTVTVEYIYV